MKNQPCLRFVWLLCCAAFLVVLFSVPVRGEIIDKVAGIVNEEVITLSELLKIVQPQSTAPALFGSPDKVRPVLEKIIEQKLITQEASQAAIKVSDAEVDQAIERFKEGNRISTAQLKEALRKDGLTWEEYREKLREEISGQHVIAQKIRSQVTVTDKDIDKYYQEHIDDFIEPPKVKIEQLFFPFPPDATPDMKNNIVLKAEDAAKRIKSGEDHQKLAKEHGLAKEGDSFDLGYFKKGELMGPLDAAAFSLNIGEVSDIIPTEKGCCVIRVLDRAEAETKTIDEAREKIYNQLYQQKMEKKYREWIQELHNKAYIEIKI